MVEIKLSDLSHNDYYPFFVQYGRHDDEMIVHTHRDFTELVIVCEGSATHVVDNERYNVSKGDVFVIGQGHCHGYTDTDNFRIYNILFRLDELLEVSEDLKRSKGFHTLFLVEPATASFESRLVLSAEEFSPAERIVELMLDEYDSGKECREAMIKSCFTMLTVMLSRMYESHFVPENDNGARIASAAVFMQKHFEEDITLQMLTQRSHYSIRHFIRLFKQIYNITPQQYLQKIRLEHACFLLTNSSATIYEIAQQCGFSDSNYFSNTFRKFYGTSPTVYRQNHIFV